MKKILKIALASFAVFSLISCVDSQTSNSNSNSSDSKVPLLDIYYTVTFLNYDDSLLCKLDVKEGEEAVYSGETPTRAEDDEFTYTFKGWDKDLSIITENVTTKAEYNYVPKENWGPIIK